MGGGEREALWQQQKEAQGLQEGRPTSRGQHGASSDCCLTSCCCPFAVQCPLPALLLVKEEEELVRLPPLLLLLCSAPPLTFFAPGKGREGRCKSVAPAAASAGPNNTNNFSLLLCRRCSSSWSTVSFKSFCFLSAAPGESCYLLLLLRTLSLADGSQTDGCSCCFSFPGPGCSSQEEPVSADCSLSLLRLLCSQPTAGLLLSQPHPLPSPHFLLLLLLLILLLSAL